MDSLLVLLALVPIALLILMIVIIGRVSALSRDLKSTREQLALFLRTATVPPAAPPPSAPPVRPPPVATVPPPPVITPPPPVVAPPPVVPPPVREDVPLRPAAPVVPQVPRPVDASRPIPVVSAPSVAPLPPLRPPPPRRPTFLERNPDLEKFIGENLINKIGIAVLVVGIGLLLRYAKDLISDTGRTLIGLAAGGLLVFFAHRLRNGLRAFSSVLVAGGIAVFYSTIYIAFHEYHLIGQTAGFAIMVGITGLAVALTLAYDRKELAVISLLGGFAAPFLVSTGDGNFRVLFTYLLILDAGMLVLANFKKWHVIHVLSFALTLLIFGGWAIGPYTSLEPRPSLLGFAFATAFFVVFFLMGLRYNLRHRKEFTALDHSLLLVNTAAYYAAGMHLLSDLTVRVTGLFTVLIGLFYLGFAYSFHKREGIPRSLQLLLIGLVLTFISLAAPVQLEGSHITLFWAAEAVLLLWFGQRTQLRLVERASVLVTGLMLISLCMDLSAAYGWNNGEPLRLLLNKGWITGLVATASFAGTVLLLRRGDRMQDIVPGFSRRQWSVGATVLGIAVLYSTCFLELRYQFLRVRPGPLVDVALMGYTLFYVLALELATRKAPREQRGVVALLPVLCGLTYITGYYTSSRWALMERLGGGGMGWCVLHAVAFVLLVALLVRQVRLVRSLVQRPSQLWNVCSWSFAIFLVVVASQELDQLMILAHGSIGGLDAGRRVGYPILWGMGSFAFMWYGMRHRVRALRVFALSLFGVTLVKLFLFDLGSLSEGGRVAAFIVLGALLLVVSFMYQKLKGLLLDDDAATKKTDDASA